jgi:hypothetical protein
MQVRRPDGKKVCLVHFANLEEAERCVRIKQNQLYQGKHVLMKVLE